MLHRKLFYSPLCTNIWGLSSESTIWSVSFPSFSYVGQDIHLRTRGPFFMHEGCFLEDFAETKQRMNFFAFFFTFVLPPSFLACLLFVYGSPE